MGKRSRRRDKDGPVVPPAPGALGMPADPVSRARGERLKAAIQRWRQRRQHRTQGRRENPGHDIGAAARATRRDMERRFDEWGP